jgi:hypothetical protein
MAAMLTDVMGFFNTVHTKCRSSATSIAAIPVSVYDPRRLPPGLLIIMEGAMRNLVTLSIIGLLLTGCAGDMSGSVASDQDTPASCKQGGDPMQCYQDMQRKTQAETGMTPEQQQQFMQQMMQGGGGILGGMGGGMMQPGMMPQGRMPM